MWNRPIGANRCSILENKKVKEPLYRDPINGKIGGVCAGIAQYLGIDVWLVRGVAVVAFFLGFGVIAVVVYAIAVVTLDKRPLESYQQYQNTQQGGASQSNSNSNSFGGNRNANGNGYNNTAHGHYGQGETMSQMLKRLSLDVEQLEQKTRKMESHVTSSEFELNRKFKHL